VEYKTKEQIVLAILAVEDIVCLKSTSKKTQMRGARRAMGGGVLVSCVDAKSVERNEAYEAFSGLLGSKTAPP
jgi:hypothetical protein